MLSSHLFLGTFFIKMKSKASSTEVQRSFANDGAGPGPYQFLESCSAVETSCACSRQKEAPLRGLECTQLTIKRHSDGKPCDSLLREAKKRNFKALELGSVLQGAVWSSPALLKAGWEIPLDRDGQV